MTKHKLRGKDQVLNYEPPKETNTVLLSVGSNYLGLIFDTF